MSGTSLQRRLDAVLHGISICGIYLFTYPNIYFQISISQNPHIQRNLVWLLVFSPVWLLVFSLVWLLGFSPVWLLVSGTSCWEDLMPWDMASALVAVHQRPLSGCHRKGISIWFVFVFVFLFAFVFVFVFLCISLNEVGMGWVQHPLPGTIPQSFMSCKWGAGGNRIF